MKRLEYAIVFAAITLLFVWITFLWISGLFFTIPQTILPFDNLPIPMDTVAKRANLYQKILTPAAIVLGGIFVIYRLQVERTHAPRLQSEISCEPTVMDERLYLALTLTCTNVGQSEIGFMAQRSDITFSYRKAGLSPRIQPQKPVTFPASDTKLEPGEVLLEVAWFEEDINDWTAVEVEIRIARDSGHFRSYKSIVNVQTLRSETKKDVVLENKKHVAPAERTNKMTWIKRRFGIE